MDVLDPKRISSSPDFEPYQIVCLESHQHRLYAEVIQMAEGRQVCWVRPLVLVTQAGQSHLSLADESLDCADASERAEVWYNLRDGSDLLCPISLLRAALDVEAIPFLSCLGAGEPASKSDRSVQDRLNQFIKQLWQAQPEAFQ